MTHRTDGTSQVDRGRHPALFQRVTRSAPPAPVADARTDEPAATPDIYAAVVEFLQFRPAEIHHREERVRHASGRVWNYLDACGFYPEEIEQLQFGVYTSAEDVRGYLRSVGFSDADISASGLVTDERDTFRHDWHGCLVVPLTDENGQVRDVQAVIPTAVPDCPVRYELARGAERSHLPAYGLKRALETGGRKNLVLVEDIVEALYLQCRGFTNVAAVGGDGREFSARRWEELARLGVEAVTLAFGNDATRQRDVREALDQALKARSAPEVFVLERTQLLENETLADVARRHGLEACRKAAAAKSLAFHGKDFGWSSTVEPARRNGHATRTVFHRENYRSHLRSEAEKVSYPPERTAIQATIGEVDEALFHRRFARARAILEARLGRSCCLPARPEARAQTVNAVLGRLCEDTGRAVIPEHLSRYDGNELQAGTLTVLANESPRGRLADLCSRLVSALETRPDQTWVVFCREFSEEVIVLGLIAHMTRRMTTAQGLTFEEIQARLSGRDPRDGYSDKPWLVDEALDRLQRWKDRLHFVTNAGDVPQSAMALDRIADHQSLGGVFFDSLPAAGLHEQVGAHGWKPGSTSAEMLRELATRFSCAVVAVTDHVTEPARLSLPEPRASEWRFPETSRAIRDFREMIAYWIDQEERAEIRVA